MKLPWKNIKKITLATVLALVFLTCNTPVPAAAKDALLGSPDFRASPQQPVGWRGDWTGKYPGANPPVHWGRTMKQLGDLKCLAAVPKDNSGAGATQAITGFFSEWLVAGPIPCVDQIKAIKEELLPGEAAFAPQEGDKLGDAAWRKVKVEDSFIDLFRAVGMMTSNQAAYAQSCIFVEKPTKIWFRFVHARGVTFWFNGQFKFSFPDWPQGIGSSGYPVQLNLQPGWNRFLFKVTPRLDKRDDFPPTCYIRCRFWPVDGPHDYEEKNIAWIKPMPGLSQAMPIVVGDLIFTTAHTYNLVCLDKKSGKILWIRPNSPYDAATGEDRKTKPELFAKLDELAAKRDAYYAAFVAGAMPTGAVVQEEGKLEADMDKLMVDVDQRYKRPVEQGEPDWWTIPTPASDGRNVYVFLTRGVSAAYDLKGKRKWIRYERPQHQHHGFFGSPVIADNKFVILDGTVTALDIKDGSPKWSVDNITGGRRIWFSSLGRCAVGGADYVLCPSHNVMIRAGDGRIFGAGVEHCTATPVFQDGAIWQTVGSITRYPVNASTNDGVTIGPAKSTTWNGRDNFLGLNLYQGHGFGASPLIHDGLVYAVTYNGVLMVFDAATMDFVYRQELPLDLYGNISYVGASVTLAGQYIYLMGSTGVMIVIKPGRKYEEVARNRIQNLAKQGRMLGNYGYLQYFTPFCDEYQDGTMSSTPIFDGRRMYFRGMANLYCVEEK